jgi:[acyl-carrier-protein] S-malonyltransferase
MTIIGESGRTKTEFMDPSQLKAGLSTSAFAFRGYNTTNLGRSFDLLRHSDYGPIVRDCLKKASDVCSDVTSKRVDLIGRVRRQRQTTLRTYSEAIGLILAMEQAHIKILRECFDIDIKAAQMCFGFSLGEISAIAAAGVVDLYDAMRVPVALANDCAELAKDVTLVVLFSRGRILPVEDVNKLCQQINQEGRGVIDVSAHLSPNSFLMMGQGDTIDRFKKRMTDVLPAQSNLRKNDQRFPPLHTSITWQRAIPNRAALLMQTLPGALSPPLPPVLSLVSGQLSYNRNNAREILHQWVDHPQRLWDAVYATLKQGVETVIHVGPEPNIIPATYKRLRDNVEAETKGSVGMRALKAVVQHGWLKPLLPQRAALLRSPQIKQIVLEDWLLEQGVS